MIRGGDMKIVHVFMFLLVVFLVHPLSADNRDDFIAAAEEGDIETVRRLIDEGADVNMHYAMSGLLPGFPPVERWTPLMTAAIRNDTELAQLLFDSDADLNFKNYSGNAALHWAAKRGSTAVAEILINGGADVNLQNNIGETPLYWASASLQLEFLKLLLAAGADVNLYDNKYSPLWKAAREGGWRIVELLLQNGAVPDSAALLAAAANSGSTEVIQLLIGAGLDVVNPDGNEALGYLIENGDNEGFTALIEAGVKTDGALYRKAFAFSRSGMMRKLLDSGGKPDSLCSELTLAAVKGEEAILGELIENGEYIDAKDRGGRTALASACAAGHTELAQIMIKAGADVNMIIKPAYMGPGTAGTQTGNASTALVLAAAAGDTEMCRILLDAGADPNLPGGKGYAPLHAAARDGNAATVELLLDAGADPDPVYHFRNTPLFYAVKRNSSSIVQLLLDAGADPHHRIGAGNTYLHIAARSDSSDVIGPLAEAGLDVNELDSGMLFAPESKKTPLQWINGRGYAETENALIRYGGEKGLQTSD